MSRYKRTNENKVDVSEGINYSAVHFIRCHSKNNDPTDVKTQIWGVMFEPHPDDNNKTTHHVATCGGDSVTVIDVNSGIVEIKYKDKDTNEQFFTLAWTTLTVDDKKINVLATGGIQGEIKMIHPQNKVCYHTWRAVNSKKTAVYSLVFHSNQPTWLFSGSSDGLVTLWDVGTPILPSYDRVHPKIIMKLSPNFGSVYNIAWSGHESNWLLAGTEDGLVGWNMEAVKVKQQGRKYCPIMVDFLLPKKHNDGYDVDSIAVVGEWTIVAKCIKHGLLYVWDLKNTTLNLKRDAENNQTVLEKEVKMVSTLKYLETDNYFMNIGCHKGAGLIVCGDDQGALWLYDTQTLGQTFPKSLGSVVDPSTLLLWPEVQDDNLEENVNLLQNDEIIIDKVATSHDSRYIVAVTNINLVCIWRKI